MDLAYPFLAAYILDLAFGDPPAWPHPVRLMGHLCTFWEGALYRPSHLAGAFFFLAVLGSTLSLLWLVLRLAGDLPFLLQGAVAAYLLYTGLATRSLHLESRLVEEALRAHDLPLANRVAHPVHHRPGAIAFDQIFRCQQVTRFGHLSLGKDPRIFATFTCG